MIQSKFEIVKTTTGATSIRNRVVNEIMHNPVGPWAEANSLYIEQSEFARHYQLFAGNECVVFDVGLGAAANALALIDTALSLGVNRNGSVIKIVSFERDLDLLVFALAHAQDFAHIYKYREAIEQITTNGHWNHQHISWELRHGDFLDLIDTEKNLGHFIFYDPYSPVVNQDMWTTKCFEKVWQKCDKTAAGPSLLITYSISTAIRTAMLYAGFYVGHGNSTGLKEETTVASTNISNLARPLGRRWLERWHRSHVAFPLDIGDLDKTEVTNRIIAHPQFTDVLNPPT